MSGKGTRVMRIKHLAPFVVMTACKLAGCGVNTPDMNEFGEAAHKVGPNKAALVAEIKCEIARGIHHTLTDRNFGAGAANPGKSLDWLLKWVVKADLQITVYDKGTFGPGVTITSPLEMVSQTVSLGLGFQASTDAQRKEDIGFTYALQDLEDDLTKQAEQVT